MKAMKTKLLATALTLLAAGTANASLVDGIVDQWTVGVDTVFKTSTICDSNGDCTQPNGITIVNDKSLRWGTPTGSGSRSGLDITNSPASGLVTTNGPSVANVSITHINQPITGTTLSSLDILSNLTLTPFDPSGAALPASVITFKVHYLETPNGANPCADGATNGLGVNAAGCADIYVTDQSSLNFPFFYDLDGTGTTYGLQQYFISFFEKTTGLNPLSAAACAAVGVSSPCLGFETPEGANTPVQFASLITTQKVVINVPEPGILALLGLSFAAMGFSLRRKT